MIRLLNRMFNISELFECAHLKLALSGQVSKQACSQICRCTCKACAKTTNHKLSFPASIYGTGISGYNVPRPQKCWYSVTDIPESTHLYKRGLTSLASHTLHRERIWSRCSWRVVAKECNYQTQQLDNWDTSWRKVLLHDNGCNIRRARISLVTASFCCGDNSMVVAWPDPSSLCKQCGLQDLVQERPCDIHGKGSEPCS